MFSDGSDVIVDFWQAVDSYKTAKIAWILRVLSKINTISLCSATKIKRMLFLAQFCYNCVCFLNFYVLDGVHNRILQCFHKFQSSIYGSDL